MTSEVTGMEGDFIPCGRPPIRIRVIDRDRNGKRWNLVLDDGSRQFPARIDLRDSRKRKQLVQDLKRRWPDLNDDAHRASTLLDDLDTLAASQLRPQPSGDTPSGNDELEGLKYFADERGMFWRKPGFDGPSEIQLTNFTARIVTEIREDDGVNQQVKFEIELTMRGQTQRVVLSVEEFLLMNWHLDALGARATIEAGNGIREHTRAAIQFLSNQSGAMDQRTVYRHLGWCQIDGAPYFLHAKGAVGRSDIEVRVGAELSNFVLPETPDESRLREAVKISLSVLELAEDSVTLPILAAVYRSVIPVHPDHAIWLHGRSGTQKSELAALAQQHFGAGMDRHHLPTSFSSSPNFNEALAFYAKNVTLVVDDYAPQAGNAQRLRSEAERLFRGQGNHSGRGRMTSSAELKTSKPSRSFMLATAEDLPPGYSLRARLFTVAINRGDVDLAKLTTLQVHAGAGRLAEAMSGFVTWLGPRLELAKTALATTVRETRNRLRGLGHARNSDQIAQLLFGFDALLAYAVHIGALECFEAASLRERAWQALVGVGRQQAENLVGEDPAIQFIRLLNAVLDSGEGKLTPDPRCPQNPEATTGELVENHIGWSDAQGIYLDFELAFAAIQRLARAQGGEVPNSPITIKKRLYESGFLSKVESEHGRVSHYEPKRSIRLIKKKRLLHLHPDLESMLENAGIAGTSGTEEIPTAPPVPDFGDGDWTAGTEPGTTEVEDEENLPSDACSGSPDFGIRDPELNDARDGEDGSDSPEGVAQ